MESVDQIIERLLPFICEQDYNRAIKKMIKLAGINRMVTTLNTVTREEEKHPIWEVASSHMAMDEENIINLVNYLNY